MQYSKDLTNVIEKSKKFAITLKRPNVCLDTLFHSLLQSKSHSISVIFHSLNLKREEFRLMSEIVMIKKKESKKPSSRLSKEVREVLDSMEGTAETLGIDYIAPEILLFALLKYTKKVTVIKYLSREIDFAEPLMERTWAFLTDKMPKTNHHKQEEVEVEDSSFLEMFEENEILNEFGENLNLKALSGKFDNLINFNKEKVDEVITTLLRKRKANVVLVGEGGVGKSVTVEIIAKMIVTGEAPDLIQDKVIYSVDISRMVAGTEYRGQFERRLTNFIKEASKYENLILFFDEIHTLVGAGGGGKKGDLEASNILKPALANGDLSVIGATTTKEYETSIKADSALDRRFHKVIISEPSKYKMREILPTLASYYEREHDVVFSEAFLDGVVENCEKYLPNRRYPDKAIDIIDTVGAKARMVFQGTPDYVKAAQKELLDISESIFNNQTQDESAIQQKIEDIKTACEQWEIDYISKPRIVDKEELDEFFEKKKRPALRGKFLEVAEMIHEDKKDKVLSFLNSSKRDSNSILFYGEKEVGKTTLCRAFLDYARKNEIDVVNFSGMDFSLKELYNRILNCDSALVVIDDLSSLSGENARFLSKILKDKRIERTNGEVVDFSNIDFILTCDSKKGNSVGFDKQKSDLEPSLDESLCKVICNKLLLN